MYYDGANWKWGDGVTSFTCYPGGKMVNGKEVTEKEFKKSLDAWCGVKEKGDEMRLRFIDRDGKKILQVAHDYHGYETWADVPCVEEKKEPRKLWELIHDKFKYEKLREYSWVDISAFAIDAVIECFDEWINNCQMPRPFPEYLKEKLGNEGVK